MTAVPCLEETTSSAVPAVSPPPLALHPAASSCRFPTPLRRRVWMSIWGDVRRDEVEKGGLVSAAAEVSEGAGVVPPSRCARGWELRQADSSEHFAPAAFGYSHLWVSDGLMLRWIDA